MIYTPQLYREARAFIRTEGARMRLASLCHGALDARITARAALAARLQACAQGGQVRITESGRDCDGVRYADRDRGCIAATPAAYWKLHSEIADWADGPFSLCIEQPDYEPEPTSRDLTLEAFENGHPHYL